MPAGFVEVFRRSEQVPARETLVRLPGSEDHLRLLCLDFVRQGGRQPMRLCDVGAVLESLPRGFDWDYFWGGKPRRTSWLRAVLGLTHGLLGANMPEGAADECPGWLKTAVLQTWGDREIDTKCSRDLQPLSNFLLRPRGLWRAVCRRLPNVVEASFRLKRPAEESPWTALLHWRFLLRRGKRYLARRITPEMRPSGHSQ